MDRNDPLSTAIRELYLVFPNRELEVERVDVDKSGFLQLTASNVRGTRWFTHDDRGLIERQPARDADLALSKYLATGPEGEWEVISYRQGRRIVLRVGASGQSTIWKGHRRKRSTRAAMNHRIAQETSENGAFRVPRLLRHEQARETLIFETIHGDPIHLDDSNVEVWFRVGAALGRFQESPVSRDLESFLPRDEVAVVDAWKRKVLSGVGSLPEGWMEVRKQLEHSLARLPEAETGLCHRDLHDGQFLAVDGKPVLMDFDLLCTADVALDPANLLAHFSLRALQGLSGADEQGTRSCGEALLDGLDRQQDDSFWIRLRFYQATTFLRLALVYRLRPRWESLSKSLVDLGRRCLEDQTQIG